MFLFSSMSPTSADLLLTPVILGFLVWLSIVDWRSFRLPDAGTLPLLLLGLTLAVWREAGVPWDAVVGAGIGFCVFAAIGEYYFRSRGVDALGLGDAKLLAAGGALLGWQALPMLILIGSFLGIAFALISRADRGKQIAFGPMLAFGIAALWVAFLGSA